MQDQTTQDLLYQLQQLIGCSEQKKNIRKQACSIAHKLWLELEEPGDLVCRVALQNQETPMLSLAMDLGIHDYLVKSDCSVSSEDLAKATGTDIVLMQRILRNLAGLGHIEETGLNAYRSNKFSKAFTTPGGRAGAKCARNFVTEAWLAIPSFLKSNGYQSVTDPLDTPLQYALNTKKHFFEILVETGYLEDFQTFMSNYRVDRAEFLDVYPAEDQLLPHGPQSNDEVMMVDVGGGHGHEIEKFVLKFPQAKGRMVLQDQPNVISEVKSDNMEVMSYDFFTPQPVKGARAYYMRMIIHDWPDEQALSILKNHIHTVFNIDTVQAMTPGYSKILINDVVLPEKGAGRFPTQSDMTMLTLLAAMERTEVQWRALLEKAGLKNIKIWYGDPESVIEAEA